MKIKLRIRSKMLIGIIGSVALVYITSISVIWLNIKKTAFNDATNYIDAYISEKANVTMGEFNNDMTVVRTLAQAFSQYTVFPSDKREEIVRSLYLGVFENNPQFYSLWDSWELSETDPEWTLPHGRRVENHWRDGNIIRNYSEYRNLDGDHGDYARIKQDAIETAEEPYYDSFTDSGQEEILMTSFISPIKRDGRYIGIVGVDISLEQLQEKIIDLHPYPGSYVFLLSYEGIVIAHPNREFINKPFTEIYGADEAKINIFQRIKMGADFSFNGRHYEDGRTTYNSFAPVLVGQSVTPWSMGIAVPLKEIMKAANESINQIIVIALIGLVISIIVIWLVAWYITEPLIKVAAHAKKYSEGDFSQIFDINRNDEVGELSDALNETASSFNEITRLAMKVSRGDLTEEMEESLVGKNGNLILAFREMIAKLRLILHEISSNAEIILEATKSLNNNSNRVLNAGKDQESFTTEVTRSMTEIDNVSQIAVKSITAGVDEVAETVSSLNGIIERTKVIQEIYSKTNFIALNAAIEAARAGEHGRGFSVVAKEIQKLAEQSRHAAAQIDIISNQSIEIANKSLENLNSIVVDIRQTSSHIMRIIDSGENGKQNGTADLVRLKEITGDNLEISKDISINSKLLAKSAEKLKESINFFKTE
jgi:methyl-accepting chemotaxis protein